MSDAPLPEPLEQFLQTPPSLPADAAFQQTILEQTTSLLPRRPARRNWALIGAIAASVMLAFCAGWISARTWSVDTQPRKEFVEQKTPETPKEEPKTPLVAAAPAQPRELEWAAFDTMDDQGRARLYFRAGDLYLERHNDIASAVRCYQQAIASCGAEDLAFDPNDNWLALALKNDNRKER